MTDLQSYLIYSCYTRERCRFGRGCIFAHGIEELNEWIQEYDRKKNEKLRKEISEKKEVCSLEMVSSILKGPAEDVSQIILVCCFIMHERKDPRLFWGTSRDPNRQVFLTWLRGLVVSFVYPCSGMSSEHLLFSCMLSSSTASRTSARG